MLLKTIFKFNDLYETNRLRDLAELFSQEEYDNLKKSLINELEFFTNKEQHFDLEEQKHKFKGVALNLGLKLIAKEISEVSKKETLPKVFIRLVSIYTQHEYEKDLSSFFL